MDTNSVQAAFSTIPPVTGSFTWSTMNLPNDTMTFYPDAGGFPQLTNITVKVTNSAFDGLVSGRDSLSRPTK